LAFFLDGDIRRSADQAVDPAVLAANTGGAVVEIDDMAVLVMEALDDSVSFVRRYAADALGNIKHKPAKDKLMQLAQSDTDGDVRNVAKQAADKL
ncbi:MAG TPA: HEAT repeat domain-containing protein, partial [bacterium]|nr:HEAT repeat domain-containing protein [bacterium]